MALGNLAKLAFGSILIIQELNFCKLLSFSLKVMLKSVSLISHDSNLSKKKPTKSFNTFSLVFFFIWRVSWLPGLVNSWNHVMNIEHLNDINYYLFFRVLIAVSGSKNGNIFSQILKISSCLENWQNHTGMKKRRN